MALKDLLLHIDHSPGYPARLELAINLARTHEAELKGICVLSHDYYAPRDGEEAEAARKAESIFRERTAQAGISAQWLQVDWNVVGVGVSEILRRYAYCTDLLIVGQPGAADIKTAFDIPERLGLGTGCPLLMVPDNGAFPVTGSRVMVAWKAGREASRSVRDAMPILEKAAKVTVLTIRPDGGEDGTDGDEVGTIRSHLALHKVPAEYEQIFGGSDSTVGDLLINQAFEQKMDLLVMGAYAPSLRAGFVLSPVTKHLIRHLTVPILISL